MQRKQTAALCNVLFLFKKNWSKIALFLAVFLVLLDFFNIGALHRATVYVLHSVYPDASFEL